MMPAPTTRRTARYAAEPPCPTCVGNGLVPTITLSGSRLVADLSTTCEACEGTGTQLRANWLA